jgi:hypothetical protein
MYFLEDKTWQQQKTRTTMFAPKIHNSKTSLHLGQDFTVVSYVLIFLDKDQYLQLKFQSPLKSHCKGILFQIDKVLSRSTPKVTLMKMRVWLPIIIKELQPHLDNKLLVTSSNNSYTAKCSKNVTQICRNCKT